MKKVILISCVALGAIVSGLFIFAQAPPRDPFMNRRGIPDWELSKEMPHDVFTFVRIRYNSYGFRGRKWATDYPDADLNFSYRLQELTYGGPDHETRRMLDLLADEVEGVSRRKNQIADPRNPVAGTRLIRDWNGVEHTITVLKDGFEWQGRKYKSLSGIAREITGVRWNGYRFFGLQVRSREV